MSGDRKTGAEAVSSLPAGPLLDPEEYGAHYGEVAGNLRSLEGPPGSVVVTGAEEGVGCSSVCLGTGGALAAMGLRVAIVDCNLGRPRLHRMVGEPNFTGLTTALGGDGEPEDCGYEPVPGLLVVPTGPIPEDPASSLDSDGLSGVVGGLRESRDAVLLDSPHSREILESSTLSKGFDGVLLVVHATRTAKSVAREAADGLVDAGANLLGVVLNGRS